jgi:hypothetical protein
MRTFGRIALHVTVFAVVYAGARRLGVRGEVPYIVAALATAALAHLMYRRHRRGGR